MPLHVSSTRAYRQEAKLVLYSLWYHQACFIMSLFHASTCFEHTCSSSGGQNCTIQSLVSSNLFYNEFISCPYMFRAHVLLVRGPNLYYTASGIIKPVL